MKRIVIIIAGILLILGVSGCSANKSSNMESPQSNSVSQELYGTSEGVSTGISKADSISNSLTDANGADNSVSIESDYKVDSSTSDAGTSDTITSGTGNTEERKSPEIINSSNENKASSANNRKLIQTVDLSIETLEFDKFTSFLEDKVASYGGYIESSDKTNNSYLYDNLKNADYTIRIPEEQLKSFLKMVGETANITNETSSTEDITLSYYDTESRKKSLEIQQERLLEILEKAKTVKEILEIEERLGEITYQLEAQATTLKNYDNLVSFSTVHLYISEVERETKDTPQTIGDKMKDGLEDTLYNIKKGFENFAIGLVTNLPYVIFWIFVIIVILVVFFRKRKKIKRRRQEIATEAAKIMQEKE